MKISVVVCTKDRPELLKDCLDSLSRSRLSDLEILVVDQSSGRQTEEIASVLARDDLRIRYIATTTIGLSRARNIGIRWSEGDVVAFTDDDCVPASDWPAVMAQEFVKNPEVSAIYGRCLAYEPVAPGERPIGIKADTRRRVFSGKSNPWRVGHGNNMAFRRDALEKIGDFDEALGPGGALSNCDDADFTYRALKAGVKLLYSPAPVIFHKQFRHGNDLWKLEEQYGIGAGALYSKHLRRGDRFVLWLMLDRWIRAGAVHIIFGMLTMRPHHIKLGWYRIYYSIRGMRAARIFQVSDRHIVFAQSVAGEQADERQSNVGSHMHTKQAG